MRFKKLVFSIGILFLIGSISEINAQITVESYLKKPNVFHYIQGNNDLQFETNFRASFLSSEKILFTDDKNLNLNIDSPLIKTQSLSKLMLSKSHVYDCYGTICKMEVQMDKKTKISTRFRLGNLDYVNSLEGKR